MISGYVIRFGDSDLRGLCSETSSWRLLSPVLSHRVGLVSASVLNWPQMSSLNDNPVTDDWGRAKIS